jgi:hypothetical protein
MRTRSSLWPGRMGRSTFYSRSFTERRKSGDADLRGLKTRIYLCGFLALYIASKE